MVVTARNSKNNSYPERVKRKKESNIKKERESDNIKRVYVRTLMSVSTHSRTLSPVCLSLGEKNPPVFREMIRLSTNGGQRR